MTVLLDDWTLSELSGAMDWVVTLPPGAAHSSFGNTEHSHSYPALYTELTPTVITGCYSASASSAAAAPIVYARLSSIVSVEKIGPRQLRLRQQLGWPGSSRLLFLTASSTAACDDWWRALHRLTYHNSNPSSAETTYNSALAGNFAADQNLYSDVDLWQEHHHHHRQNQQPQSQPSRQMMSNDFKGMSHAGAQGPGATTRPRSQPQDSNDAAEQQRVLLSPSPNSEHRIGRPALPLPVQPPPRPQTEVRRAAQPAALVRAEASLSASAIDTATTVSADESAATTVATTSLDVVAGARHRHTRHHPHRHRRHNDRASASASSHCAASPLVVPRATRSEATQTAAAVSSARPLMSKMVMAPALHSLLSESTTEQEKRDDAAVAPTADVSAPARLPSSLKVPDFSTLPRPPTPNAPPPRHSPGRFAPADGVASSPPASAATVAAVDAVAASEFRWNPKLASLRADTEEPSHSPLAGSSWRIATRALMPVAAPVTPATTTATMTAKDPFLYEPIHIDTSAVPRARSTASLVSRLSAPAPLSPAHLVSWSSQGRSSPRTPRITYGGSSASPRRRSGSKELMPLNSSRKDNRYPSSPYLKGRERQHGSRSPHAPTARPHDSHPHSRSPSPPSGLNKQEVSPLLSVIAKPHLFLKHPVQMPRQSHNGGARGSGLKGGEGVATYAFVTTDEACVVTVPARRFKECVEASNLLHGRPSHGRGSSRRPSPSSLSSMSIAVRSYERAKDFFGEPHCRAIRVGDVDRVTRGNEEPLILLNSAQRERFRDPSKLVCIVSHTHAFLMEATNSTEAEWYVRSWKKYIRASRGPSSEPHRATY